MLTHIRSELEVRDTSLDVLVVRVVQVTVDDLLGKGERSVQSDSQRWSAKRTKGNLRGGGYVYGALESSGAAEKPRDELCLARARRRGWE